MARKVERQDIVDFETYSDERDDYRERMFEIKRVRRVHVGEALTFLFENHATTLYQIQEMMRAERIVKESAIQHEIDTYNGLLGGPGEIACSLLIEIDDPVDRRRKLTQWLDLPRHLYLELDAGERVRARYDASQIGGDRLSAVQYLRFDTHGHVPVAAGSDLPEFERRTELTRDQRDALAADLRE